MIELRKHSLAELSRAERLAVAGALAGVSVIGLVAARYPVSGLLVISIACAVAILLLRTELAILLLVATGPLGI